MRINRTFLLLKNIEKFNCSIDAGPLLIPIEVSHRGPPNSVVAKVPIFGDLHHTFWPKSAKYRDIYQIWVHATDRWRENANFA